MYIYERWRIRSPVPRENRCGHAWCEYRCSSPNGILSIFRVQRFLLWRSTCKWKRWSGILYKKENDYDEMGLAINIVLYMIIFPYILNVYYVNIEKDIQQF